MEKTVSINLRKQQVWVNGTNYTLQVLHISFNCNKHRKI